MKDDLGNGVHEKCMAYIDSLEEVMRQGIAGEETEGDGSKGHGPWVCGDRKFLRFRVDHEPEGVFPDLKGPDYHEHIL